MAEKIKNVELIVYDFDGVMTDNRVLVLEDGREGVFCNRSDGLAVEMLKRDGFKQLIITKETNNVVESRAKKLNIPILKGIDNKKEILIDHCRENDIALENVVYVGNDFNDLEAMKEVGYPIAVSDAVEEVLNIAKIVTQAPGGAGVIRELLNYIEMSKEVIDVYQSVRK